MLRVLARRLRDSNPQKGWPGQEGITVCATPSLEAKTRRGLGWGRGGDPLTLSPEEAEQHWWERLE